MNIFHLPYLQSVALFALLLKSPYTSPKSASARGAVKHVKLMWHILKMEGLRITVLARGNTEGFSEERASVFRKIIQVMMRRKGKKRSRENSCVSVVTVRMRLHSSVDTSNYSVFHFSQVCSFSLPNLSRHFLPISSHRMLCFFFAT